MIYNEELLKLKQVLQSEENAVRKAEQRQKEIEEGIEFAFLSIKHLNNKNEVCKSFKWRKDIIGKNVNLTCVICDKQVFYKEDKFKALIVEQKKRLAIKNKETEVLKGPTHSYEPGDILKLKIDHQCNNL